MGNVTQVVSDNREILGVTQRHRFEANRESVVKNGIEKLKDLR
jgi:hypothetical protein